jgi:hypothetical protein
MHSEQQTRVNRFDNDSRFSDVSSSWSFQTFAYPTPSHTHPESLVSNHVTATMNKSTILDDQSDEHTATLNTMWNDDEYDVPKRIHDNPSRTETHVSRWYIVEYWGQRIRLKVNSIVFHRKLCIRK